MDIGFYTLDLYAIANGQVSERHIGGAEVGVHRLLDLLVNDGHDLTGIGLALREGTLRPEASQLQQALTTAYRKFKHTQSVMMTFASGLTAGQYLPGLSWTAS